MRVRTARPCTSKISSEAGEPAGTVNEIMTRPLDGLGVTGLSVTRNRGGVGSGAPETAVSSQIARLFERRPPASLKVPPTTSPLNSVIVLTVPFTPDPRASHCVPSQRALLRTELPPATSQLPPAMIMPLYDVIAFTVGPPD